MQKISVRHERPLPLEVLAREVFKDIFHRGCEELQLSGLLHPPILVSPRLPIKNANTLMEDAPSDDLKNLLCILFSVMRTILRFIFEVATFRTNLHHRRIAVSEEDNLIGVGVTQRPSQIPHPLLPLTKGRRENGACLNSADNR